MTHTPWWKHAVFYQIYPVSFQDSDGDGWGDLQGIIDRLDYLETLGVDGLWICPCYPSPMVDGGYDVSDYTDIHPALGSLETLDRLLESAHRRGLRVLLDFVPNHTSDQHPWFQESRRSRDNPRRDWYIWRDPAADGGPPNNWLGYFSGPAWTLDPATGQYYLHSFTPQQPDLNWRNPAVRAAMESVLRFWLDRGVDGFRIDSVLPLFKDALFRDDPPHVGPPVGKDMGPSGRQERRFSANQPEVHAVLRDWRRLLDSYPGDRMMMGEVYTMDQAMAASYHGNDDELHLVLNMALLNLPWEATRLRGYLEGYLAGLPEGAVPAIVLGSHDEPRLASRLGERQARVAAMLLLTLPGVPLLYYGDEIGMVDGPVPPERQRDPWPRLSGMAQHSRDPARTPMQWDASPGAGFTPSAPAWLPLHPEYPRRNVAAQNREPRSMLSLYRKLIRLRRSTPALRSGSYRPVEGAPDACYAFLRSDGSPPLLVALNLGEEEVRVSLPGSGKARILLSTELDREDSEAAGFVRLRPAEGVIAEMSRAPA